MNFDSVVDNLRQNSGGNLTSQITEAEFALNRMTKQDTAAESISSSDDSTEHDGQDRQLAENALLSAANAALIANGKLEQGDFSGATEAAAQAEILAENAVAGANSLNTSGSVDQVVSSSDPLQRKINSASTDILENLEKVTNQVAELEAGNDGVNSPEQRT